MNKILGARIKFSRKRNRLTLSEVAKHLKVTPSYLRVVESGGEATSEAFRAKYARALEQITYERNEQ
jgi:transcriptional regulator with XRE-family HTH domain